MLRPDPTYPWHRGIADALGVDPDRITLDLVGDSPSEEMVCRIDGKPPTEEQAGALVVAWLEARFARK